MKISHLLLLFWFWIVICGGASGQTIVGMGTENPNPNAVLELVSTNQNQGFLVPRLSTLQRNASSFTSLLTDKDNGLIVFDADEGNFYYWYKGAWQVGSSADNSTPKGTVWYVGDVMPDNSQGEDTDFYIHQPTGDLYRKQDGVFLILGNLAKTENQYYAGTGISITNQNEIINTGDLDATNELQDLSMVLSRGASAGNQNITNLAAPVNAADATTKGYVDDLHALDTDQSTTNEIQDLSLSGNSLKITNNASATTIDLTSYLDNTDAQILSLSGNSLSITGGNAVNLSSINTDAQDLSLSGTTLGLSGSTTTVDLSVLQDGTGTDSQNLSSSKTATDVSLTISGGNTTTFSVADNDDDASNEKIISASLTTGDTLRIQEAGANHDVDLSGFQKKGLSTSQILVGNTSGVASPVSISGDISLNSDGTMTITLDAITTAKIINSAITTAKIADDAVTKDKINADMAGNGLIQNIDGSLEVNIAGGGLELTTDQLQLMNKNNGEVLIGDGTQVNSRTISGDITLANTGAATVAGLQGRQVVATAPAIGEVLTWDGLTWLPQAHSGSSTKMWHSGSVEPSSVDPAAAVNGDYYYHTGIQIVYRKENDVWVELGRWAKPSGSTVTGATITSTSTSTLYIGSGQPINGTTDNAQPGDMYFNTSEGSFGRLYIKKNYSEWQGL